MKHAKAPRPTPRGARTPPRTVAPETFPLWVVPLTYALAVIVLFPEFIFRGALLLGTDTYGLSYFARDFYTSTVLETKRFPLWDPLLFGGLPFVDGMHGDIFYPLSLALFFFDTRAMWGWKMVLHLFLAGVFTYIWLRSIGLRRGPALLGGLVYMMGPDLVSLVYPGGDGKLFVSALAPLVFWLAERAVARRTPSDFAFFALGIAMVVFTSHMQLAYFCIWGVSLYFFFRVYQIWRAERNARAVTWLAAAYMLAGVIGVGAAAVQFLPPLRYLQNWSHRAERTLQAETQNAYAFSTSYSLHGEEAVSLVVPEFVGDHATGNTYWGKNPIKLNHEYAGLVPLLLFLALLVKRRDARTWFFVGLATLALLYALGASTPVFRLFYLIPGVNLFRAPSLTIFLFGLSVATLGALGLQRLLDWSNERLEEQRPARRALWAAAGVLGLLALLESAGIVTQIWQSLFVVDPNRQGALSANLPNIRRGFWITFLIAAAVAGVWELLARSFVNRRTAVVLLVIIAALDVFRVNRPFIRATVDQGDAAVQQAATLFRADESIEFLQQAKANGEIFRVLDISRFFGAPDAYPYNDLAVHGLEQMSGHHGNEIGRYRQLIGGELPMNLFADSVTMRHWLLDLTNTTYIVCAGRIQLPGFEEAFVGSRSVVYRRANALGRAYLVGRVEVAPDENAVATLLAPGFDARGTVVLPDSLPAGLEIQPDPQGTVQWVNRGNDDYTLSVTTDRPALLVISENFYPAWKAYMDNAEIPVLRANYTFRAVHVPAGTHQIRFRYDSSVLKNSAIASVVILGVLLAIGIAGLMRPAARASSA